MVFLKNPTVPAIFSLLTLSLFSQAHAAGKPPVPEEQINAAVEQNFTMRMEKAMHRSTRKALYSDLYTLLNYSIEAPADSVYASVFGNGGSSAVVSFLNDRVKYVLDGETQPEDYI